MNKLLIITGLTGSGKSELALKIAKKYNGEIISADSIQVYKQLNIGSAKVSKLKQQQVKHHLIDIKNFNETFNVEEFVTLCKLSIENIVNRGKLPIIVGGTGLYIKALINGYNLGSSADLKFRQKMQILAEKNGNNYVWEILNNKNPERAKLVHPNNVKRVIRYLELENNPNTAKQSKPLSNFNCLCIAIVKERNQIYNQIEQRVDEMLKNGLEQEVKELINLGATQDMQALTAIGYKEWFAYFNNELTYQQTINLIKQHTRNYCKRQLTFLKTIPELQFYTIEEAAKAIQKFLK